MPLSASSSVSTTSPPLTKEAAAAHAELSRIVEATRRTENNTSSRLYSIPPESEDRVLHILQSFPVLAAKGIVINVALKNLYLPLSFLVENNARLATVQQVFHLHPPAIHYKDRWGHTPLHFACQTRADPSLLKFLIDQFPQALTLTNKVGYLPLHCIMPKKCHRELTCETLDLLLPSHNTNIIINVALLVKQENDLGLNPLQLALKSNLDSDQLEYLFEKVSHHIQEFAVTKLDNDGCLSLKHAKALAKLLPYLTTFWCTSSSWSHWTLDAFVFLITAIRDSRTIEKVNLKLPREVLALYPDEACTALQDMLIQNTSLRSLHIAFNDSGSGLIHDDECIEALANGLNVQNSNNNNNTQLLDRLWIKDCSLHNGEALANLLRNAPRILHLDNLQTRFPGVPYTLQDVSRCETLSLNMTSSWYHDLISLLWTMPRLTKLEITSAAAAASTTTNQGEQTTTTTTTTHLPRAGAGGHHYRDDITEPILQLLAQDKLESLTICEPCQVDPTGILRMLEESNVTSLQEFFYWAQDYEEKGPVANQIRYYTTLNTHGRARARNPNNDTSRLEFVNLLVRANENYLYLIHSCSSPSSSSSDNDDDNSNDCYGMDLPNVLFGLLSECPGLWSEED